MDLVDRKAVLHAIRLSMTVTQIEREIMAIPGVAVAPLIDLILAKARIRELEDEGWEDRSAIQGINPRLAELIKEKNAESTNFAAMKERISEEDRLRIVKMRGLEE